MIPENSGVCFGKCAEKLALHTNHAEWGYLFESEKCLCEGLELKANLGQRTRSMYQCGDWDGLHELIPVYQETVKRVRRFCQAFEKQWMMENKPYGFEVQDIRIGGLIQRLEHCADRLNQFVNRKISNIPELEEQLLDPFGKGEADMPENFCVNIWRDIVSVNNVG